MFCSNDSGGRPSPSPAKKKIGVEAMDRSYQSEMLLHLSEAEAFIQDTSDPAIKLLLEGARYQVFRGFMRFSDAPLSDEEYLAQLPLAPFDMLFYLRSVKRLLNNKYFVIQALSG